MQRDTTRYSTDRLNKNPVPQQMEQRRDETEENKTQIGASVGDGNVVV